MFAMDSGIMDNKNEFAHDEEIVGDNMEENVGPSQREWGCRTDATDIVNVDVNETHECGGLGSGESSRSGRVLHYPGFTHFSISKIGTVRSSSSNNELQEGALFTRK